MDMYIQRNIYTLCVCVFYKVLSLGDILENMLPDKTVFQNLNYLEILLSFSFITISLHINTNSTEMPCVFSIKIDLSLFGFLLPLLQSSASVPITHHCRSLFLCLFPLPAGCFLMVKTVLFLFIFLVISIAPKTL